jgi:pimeloyl-ACP methyl ester carboxylesterase
MRGRALSADHPDHTRERLVEDIVAFVESSGDSVFLFGHLAGGTHTLEAAAHTSALGTLALSEPALMELADEAQFAPFSDAGARVRRAVAEGRPADGAWIGPI